RPGRRHRPSAQPELTRPRAAVGARALRLAPQPTPQGRELLWGRRRRAAAKDRRPRPTDASRLPSLRCRAGWAQPAGGRSVRRAAEPEHHRLRETAQRRRDAEEHVVDRVDEAAVARAPALLPEPGLEAVT